MTPNLVLLLVALAAKCLSIAAARLLFGVKVGMFANTKAHLTLTLTSKRRTRLEQLYKYKVRTCIKRLSFFYLCGENSFKGGANH